MLTELEMTPGQNVHAIAIKVFQALAKLGQEEVVEALRLD